MHELSICEAILGHVDARVRDRPVHTIHVRIGYLRQVVPDSLLFSWQVLTESTGRAGTELDVEHVPAVVHCAACGADTTLDWPVLACASCESHDVTLRSGDELEVSWIEIEEQVS